MERIGDLELDQDMAFQEQQWRVQRLGWVLLLVLLAVACSGALGLGPLATVEVSHGDGALVVTYDRFVRREMDQNIAVTVAAAPGDKVEVWLADSAVVVTAVWPEPAESRLEDGREVFVFVADTGAALEVRFDVMREDMGRETLRVGVQDVGEVSFWQMSYP